MSKKAYLFLNGEPPSAKTLQSIANELQGSDTLAVCADGAFSYVKDYFLPGIIVADFDSLKKSDVPSSVKVMELPANKDYTDGHIAMQHILDSNIKDIEIYGGGGGRIDHMISNLSLLKLASDSLANAVMDTGDYRVYLASGNFIKKISVGKIVSLVPYSDMVHIMYTRGLKYPICDRKLDKVHILGISNEAISNEIEYAICSGSALVFLEK